MDRRINEAKGAASSAANSVGEWAQDNPEATSWIATAGVIVAGVALRKVPFGMVAKGLGLLGVATAVKVGIPAYITSQKFIDQAPNWALLDLPVLHKKQAATNERGALDPYDSTGTPQWLMEQAFENGKPKLIGGKVVIHLIDAKSKDREKLAYAVNSKTGDYIEINTELSQEEFDGMRTKSVERVKRAEQDFKEKGRIGRFVDYVADRVSSASNLIKYRPENPDWEGIAKTVAPIGAVVAAIFGMAIFQNTAAFVLGALAIAGAVFYKPISAGIAAMNDPKSSPTPGGNSNNKSGGPARTTAVDPVAQGAGTSPPAAETPAPAGPPRTPGQDEMAAAARRAADANRNAGGRAASP